MSHHHARFLKNSYIGFQQESEQVFWAQIWVKCLILGHWELFIKVWAPSRFLRHNGVMQSLQSFEKILMVDPVKSCLQT